MTLPVRIKREMGYLNRTQYLGTHCDRCISHSICHRYNHSSCSVAVHKFSGNCKTQLPSFLVLSLSSLSSQCSQRQYTTAAVSPTRRLVDCPIVNALHHAALERSVRYSTHFRGDRVDVNRLRKVLKFLRDEIKLNQFDIEYINSHHWNYVVKLSQLPNLDGCRAILDRLKSARSSSSCGIFLPDVFTHHLDILTWTFTDVDCCLEEAQAIGIPLREFLSVLSAGRKKQNKQGYCVQRDERNNRRLSSLLREALECASATVARVSLRQCIQSDPRLKKFNLLQLTEAEDECTDCDNTIKSKQSSDSLSLGPSKFLNRLLELTEINQFVYLADTFHQCGVGSNDLLPQIYSIFDQLDFINDSFPRIEFLKLRQLINCNFPIRQLLLLSKTEFVNWYEFKGSGPLQFEIFKRRLKGESAERLLKDATFTSSYLDSTNEPPKSPQDLLLFFLSPEELKKLLKSLPDFIGCHAFAHFLRWHLIGRIGFQITDILKHYPRLISLPENLLRRRIDRLDRIQQQHPDMAAVTLDELIQSDSDEVFEEILTRKLQKIQLASIASNMRYLKNLKSAKRRKVRQSKRIEVTENRNQRMTLGRTNENSRNHIVKHIVHTLSPLPLMHPFFHLIMSPLSLLVQILHQLHTRHSELETFEENEFENKESNQLKNKEGTEGYTVATENASSGVDHYHVGMSTSDEISKTERKELVNFFRRDLKLNGSRKFSTLTSSSTTLPTILQPTASEFLHDINETEWSALHLEGTSHGDKGQAVEMALRSEHEGKNAEQKQSETNLNQVVKKFELSTDEAEHIQFCLNGRSVLSLKDYMNTIDRYVFPYIPKQCPLYVISTYLLVITPHIIQHPINQHLYQRIESLLNRRILQVRRTKENKNSISTDKSSPFGLRSWLMSHFTQSTTSTKSDSQSSGGNQTVRDDGKWWLTCKPPLGCRHNMSVASVLLLWIRSSDIKFRIELKAVEGHQQHQKKRMGEKQESKNNSS